MGGKGDFKVLVKLMGVFSFMDYGFAFVAWLWFVCRERGLAPTGFSWTRVALGGRQAQDLAFFLNGPVLVPVSGSNFGALTQRELSVAFAPGDLNIYLQGRRTPHGIPTCNSLGCYLPLYPLQLFIISLLLLPTTSIVSQKNGT